MGDVNWMEILGWNKDELEDLRFVGYSYIKQGKYEIALTFFEALSILSSDNAYDLQTLGALYLEKGNNLLALNFLERSLKIDPQHAPTLINRIKALFALGYKRQALVQAKMLQTHSDISIADQASALILAFA